MDFRQVGNSGLRVSVVGLGCNNFGGRIDFAATQRVVHGALDLGITLFDTADSYGNRGGSEEYLGRALGARRKDIVLATKFGQPMSDAAPPQNASRGYLMQAVEASLKRLRTDWIDLYQLHFPDPRTSIEETLRGLDDLITQGKVRYIGCSNFAAWQVIEAEWTSRNLGLNRFISCQNRYSLLSPEPQKDLLPALTAYGIGLLPHTPLAAGFLTGKYRRGAAMPEGARLTYVKGNRERYVTDENWDRIEALEGYAQARGHSLLDLAFAWLLAQPLVPSVIAGATKPEQLEANVKAGGWKLSAEDGREIGKLLGG